MDWDGVLEWLKTIGIFVIAVCSTISFFIGLGVCTHLIVRLFMFGWRWSG